LRALKSELSIRPLFHQKESRVKAHVLVAFLGHALWVTLKHLLQRRPAMGPTTLGQRNGPCSALIADEGAGFAIYAAERRHRAARHGWTRDPSTPDYRTDNRAEIPTAPARPGSP
jgi:hypothetical protein